MAGWIKPANGPYGSSRGNRVMAAKRTTGPSAQTQLLTKMKGERCSTAGCLGIPLITQAETRIHKCAACLTPATNATNELPYYH